MALQESPRLSFSNDVSPSPTFRLADDDSFSASVEFDFSTSFDASLDDAHPSATPADLLFSGGKLLPLHNAHPPSSPPQIPDPKAREGPFPRSRSANARGSSARSRRKLWKCSSESSAKAYYYTGDRRVSGGNGVRIDPVINVPAPLIPRGGSGGSSTGSSNSSGGGAGSFFAYLLCNCRGKMIGINEM